jgi:hypothetical protein
MKTTKEEDTQAMESEGSALLVSVFAIGHEPVQHWALVLTLLCFEST